MYKIYKFRLSKFNHLPLPILNQYFLDQGASMYCTLSSEHYRLSPLVQGELKIECQAVIETRATILQAKLTSRYLDLVKDLYTEPTEDIAVGNLFNFVMTLPHTVITPQAPSKRKKRSTSTSTSVSNNQDI